MADKKRGAFDHKKKHAIKEGALWPMVRAYAVSEAKPLIQEIKNRSPEDKLRKIFINYLIVRTVTVFENFLLNESYRLAKVNRRKAKQLFTDIKTNATLEDQIISSFSFTKLEDVDHVFSVLLGKNFLSAIKNESVRYAPNYFYEAEHIRYTKPLHKNWENVCKIFEFRHEIVHRNKLADMKYSEIRNLIGGTMQFLMCALMVTNQN